MKHCTDILAVRNKLEETEIVQATLLHGPLSKNLELVTGCWSGYTSLDSFDYWSTCGAKNSRKTFNVVV